MDEGSVKAIKYLLRVSPSGEIQDVLHHLATLVGSQEALESNKDVTAALRKWYETHRYHIPLPDGRVGLVTSEGNIEGEFRYYDDILKLTFKFNPFTLTAEIESEEPLVVPTSELKEALVKECANYCKGAFRAGKVLFSINQPSEDSEH